MTYQRVTNEFDGIQKIEVIPASEFRETRFFRKIDQMEADANKEVEESVYKAKLKLKLVAPELDTLAQRQNLFSNQSAQQSTLGQFNSFQRQAGLLDHIGRAAVGVFL